MIKTTNPLSWPADEARTPLDQRHSTSPFEVAAGRTLEQLETALRLFSAANIVLSMNAPFRSKIEDPAVAMFFDLPGPRPIAICCDRYYRQQDNIRAILMIIESMRRIERYGGQKMSQKSFTGFAALPAPIDIWKLLGLNKSVAEALNDKLRREYVMDGFRTKVKEGHGAGGNMADLTAARDEAMKQLGLSS